MKWPSGAAAAAAAAAAHRDAYIFHELHHEKCQLPSHALPPPTIKTQFPERIQACRPLSSHSSRVFSRKTRTRGPSPPTLPPQPLFRSNQAPRLDWPALANHPFISDCDALAPVVYMPGAVEYSQLPRVSRSAAAAAAEEAASKPSAAGSASGRSGTASARMQGAEPVQKQQQQQQQQQQYLRVGSPAEGRADVLHLGGNVSMPLSDMVGCGARGFGGGYCGFKSLFSLLTPCHQASRLALDESSHTGGGDSSISKLATRLS